MFSDQNFPEDVKNAIKDEAVDTNSLLNQLKEVSSNVSFDEMIENLTSEQELLIENLKNKRMAFSFIEEMDSQNLEEILGIANFFVPNIGDIRSIDDLMESCQHVEQQVQEAIEMKGK